MFRFAVPLISSLLLTAMFGGLWASVVATAFSDDSVVPLFAAPWFYPVFLVLGAVLASWGTFTALQLPGHSPLTYSYVLSIALLVAGVGSFFVLNGETAINIFGFLAICIGLACADVAALLLLGGAVVRKGREKKTRTDPGSHPSSYR